MTKTTFNGRELTISASLPASENMRAIVGVESQHMVSGPRGANGLMQVFMDGQRRIVWMTGHSSRTELERPS